MKTRIIITLLAIAPLFVTSCASSGSPTGATAATASGVKSYPLKTCIVTDNDLGSMGDEQRIVHQGQEIKFCCTPCVAKFQKNPEKFLAKIR